MIDSNVYSYSVNWGKGQFIRVKFGYKLNQIMKVN